MKIKNVELLNPLVIAPMAGVSNSAFRSICHEFKAGLVCAEMLSDKALYYQNVKTLAMSQVSAEEHPMSMQLFGSEIESMVYAAKLLDTQTECDIIDINMGCPVNKVVKTGAGSALMLNEEHAVELVKAIIENVHKPVSVKMRSGFDAKHINAVSLSQKLESIGVAAICVHGRTREQFYEGHADWQIIKEVKQAVKIPVIGNGDIKSVEDMIKMMDMCGVDGVAIGRAALGDPFLIKRCAAYFDNGVILPEATISERFAILKQHATRLMALKGEKVAIKEMRGLAANYVRGLSGNHQFKQRLTGINTYVQLAELCDEYQEYLLKKTQRL